MQNKRWRIAALLAIPIVAGCVGTSAWADSATQLSPPAPEPANSTGPRVQVLPPAGSTVIGSTADGPIYQLPAGAVGYYFNLPGPGFNGTTLPSTPVYASSSAAAQVPNLAHRGGHVRARAASTPDGCEITDQVPHSPTADTMEGVATVNCNSGSGITYVDVGVCLDWWSGSAWVQQNPCGENHDNKPPVGMFAEHFCAEGQTHQWRTRGNGHVTYNGKSVALPQAVVEASVECR